MVARLCEKYNCLPSDILSQDGYWLDVLMTVSAFDQKKGANETMQDQINKKLGIN